MANQFEAHPRAIRVLFHYEGTDIRVGSTQLVTMTTPPSDVVPRDERPGEPPTLAGFWFDLLDRDRRVLYRRAMDNPLLQSATIHTGDPDQPFTNVRLSEAKGEFLLLMPDVQAASTLIIYSSPADAEGYGGPAEPVARFDVEELRKGR